VLYRIISRTGIVQTLGAGTSSIYIIRSAAIVFTSFIYLFSLASYFRIPIYLLHNRLVTKLTLVDWYVINKNADHIIIISGVIVWLVLSLKDNKARFAAAVSYGGTAIIGISSGLFILVDIAALISIPIVICLSIYDRLSSKKIILNGQVNLYVNYFSILGIAIGLESLIIFSAFPLFSIASESVALPNYAYAIYLLSSSGLSPILMILLINAVPVKILSTEFIRSISKLKHASLKLTAFATSLDTSHKIVRPRNNMIYLSLIVLLTVILVSIPHQPAINKNNRLIGTDSMAYLRWENILMKSNNLQDFLHTAFVTLNQGNRPISLIFIFATVKTATSVTAAVQPYYIIDHLPVILGPALVLVIYFLTRELTSNDVASLFASFLTAVSFHTLVGVYAGFYANWFALIFGYLAFIFVFRFLKTLKKVNLGIYFSLTIVVLFSHTYTWTILTLVTGLFLLVVLCLNYFSKRIVFFVLFVLLSTVAVDIAKAAITGSVGGIDQDVSIASKAHFGLGQLPVRWNNLLDTTEIYYGAAFSNVIILLLGLYWLFRSDMRDPSNMFLIIFLTIGVFPLFFGNWLVQSRVFYNIPFQIPAGIALAFIKKGTKGTLVLMPVCIWLIAMCIRTLSNF